MFSADTVAPIDDNAFSCGFWHPFGPHGGETEEQILKRKTNEIQANGWTLWSFQHRKMDDWHRLLTSATLAKVLVFCSSGSGLDPLDRGSDVRRIECRSYRFVGQTKWQSIPERICVPHGFRSGKDQASAFVVQRLVYPILHFEPPAVEWYCLREGLWRQDRVPTRGEYLIRAGGCHPMRSVRAILELKPPYLAAVRADPL